MSNTLAVYPLICFNLFLVVFVVFFGFYHWLLFLNHSDALCFSRPLFLVVLLFSGAGSLQEVQCKRHVFQIHSLLDKFVMLMLSQNINSMLCRSLPSVWQVRPILVKMPCVCVFLSMKILPWSSLVFFCCCSCILPTSGLTRIINSVNSLKKNYSIFQKTRQKKYKLATYYKRVI